MQKLVNKGEQTFQNLVASTSQWPFDSDMTMLHSNTVYYAVGWSDFHFLAIFD